MRFERHAPDGCRWSSDPDFMGPTRQVSYVVTYQETTPESVEEGDFSEHGITHMGYDSPLPDGLCGEAASAWFRENIVVNVIEPDDEGDDNMTESTAIMRQVLSVLRSEGAIEPSQMPVETAETWWSTPWYVTSLRTGTERQESYHFSGLTDNEMLIICLAMKAKVTP